MSKEDLLDKAIYYSQQEDERKKEHLKKLNNNFQERLTMIDSKSSQDQKKRIEKFYELFAKNLGVNHIDLIKAVAEIAFKQTLQKEKYDESLENFYISKRLGLDKKDIEAARLAVLAEIKIHS